MPTLIEALKDKDSLTNLQKLRKHLAKQEKKTRLVPRKVTVKRGGKTFQRTQWVRPEEAEKEKGKKKGIPNEMQQKVSGVLDSSIKDYDKFKPEAGEDAKGFRAKANQDAFIKVFGLDNYRPKLNTAREVFYDWKGSPLSGGGSLFRVTAGKMFGKGDEAEREVQKIIEHNARSVYPGNRKLREKYERETKEEFDNASAKFGEHITDALKASGAIAQHVLKKQFGDTITVYRNISERVFSKMYKEYGDLKSGEKYRVDNGVLSSWTLDKSVASKRGKHTIKQEIPVESVLYSDRVNSSTLSGLASEDEIVFYKEDQEVELAS